jgi:lipoprotein NlpI
MVPARNRNLPTNHIDLVNWPGPALALFLGQATPATVLRTAAQAEAKKNENQSCEASFYVGEWGLMRGLFDEATPLIKKAAETCPLEFFEHKFAAAELASASLRR